MKISRGRLLISLAGIAAAVRMSHRSPAYASTDPASAGGAAPDAVEHASGSGFEVAYDDATWREKLSPEAYRVLRHEATEAPYTSKLLAEHRSGTFVCAGCAEPLFDSKTKFDSGTGWPSFYEPESPKAIGETTDRSMFMSRTEVHCARCGGHLGHVFDDGPKPTGLRYCMNGAALAFEPKKTTG